MGYMYVFVRCSRTRCFPTMFILILHFALLGTVHPIASVYSQEMSARCKDVITLHQNWMNQTDNYVYESTIFDHAENEVGTSETLVNYLSRKKYSLTIDAKKGLEAFAESDIDGGGSISVKDVGKAILPGPPEKSEALGYGDGTKGVFVRGNSPEQTIQRFQNITEAWKCVDGDGERRGLLGFQFHHNEKYVSRLKNSISEKSFGSEQLADIAKKQIDGLGGITMWFSSGDGAFKGIDIYEKKLSSSAQPRLISRIFVQNTHRNITDGECNEILNRMRSKIPAVEAKKTYSTVAELSMAIDEHRLTTKVSPLRWSLIAAGVILISVGIYFRFFRKHFNP